MKHLNEPTIKKALAANAHHFRAVQRQQQFLQLTQAQVPLQEALKIVGVGYEAYRQWRKRDKKFAAEVCHGIVSVWGMPTECVEWLMTEMPAEKVGRFLMGFTDARVRPTEPVPDIPDSLSEWMYEKIISCRPIGEYK